MRAVAAWAAKTLESQGIHLTLGGEPTFVPIKPDGAEWSHTAVGPTKLKYARKVADDLLSTRMKGGAVFFSPGKQYPGEINPRWALRVLARQDGKPVFRAPRARGGADPKAVAAFRKTLIKALDLGRDWLEFADPKSGSTAAWVLPLDRKKARWVSAAWRIAQPKRRLVEAEGPAGLRLPLYLLPERVPKRALTLEVVRDRLRIFFPPLLQDAFAELLGLVGDALAEAGVGLYELQGYVPSDTGDTWEVVGIAADPGVLEVNLPPCRGWREYNDWIRLVTAAAARCGLRPWKRPPGDYAGGTGGGNHLLWGGATIDENPFLSRPAWLASILRYWQRHPSLAYLFTGTYVGASSQAPRPDESAKELFDLEMAYRFLEGLGPGDHRAIINETLRHLHTDITGNAHRSEISFDKFWNPGWPGGTLGLIEFRAVESLPRAEWMSAVALLWYALAARASIRPETGPLTEFRGALHDRYFLPSGLWEDLERVLADLREVGCPVSAGVYRKIWDWRFERLLAWTPDGGGSLEVRRAHESWPLLCETPVEGGTTSRFVDTSLHRIEIGADAKFASRFDVFVRGRKLRLTAGEGGRCSAGLRYRRSCLYPCLHPGIEPHLPLDLAFVPRAGGKGTASVFVMGYGDTRFRKASAASASPRRGGACRPIFPGALTHDLRLE